MKSLCIPTDTVLSAEGLFFLECTVLTAGVKFQGHGQLTMRTLRTGSQELGNQDSTSVSPMIIEQDIWTASAFMWNESFPFGNWFFHQWNRIG